MSAEELVERVVAGESPSDVLTVLSEEDGADYDFGDLDASREGKNIFTKKLDKYAKQQFAYLGMGGPGGIDARNIEIMIFKTKPSKSNLDDQGISKKDQIKKGNPVYKKILKAAKSQEWDRD